MHASAIYVFAPLTGIDPDFHRPRRHAPGKPATDNHQCYSWFDLVLYLFAIVLLVPLVMRLVESISNALDGT